MGNQDSPRQEWGALVGPELVREQQQSVQIRGEWLWLLVGRLPLATPVDAVT